MGKNKPTLDERIASWQRRMKVVGPHQDSDEVLIDDLIAEREKLIKELEMANMIIDDLENK